MDNVISTHQALIYAMVTITAVDGRIGDLELQRIGRLVRRLQPPLGPE